MKGFDVRSVVSWTYFSLFLFVCVFIFYDDDNKE